MRKMMASGAAALWLMSCGAPGALLESGGQRIHVTSDGGSTADAGTERVPTELAVTIEWKTAPLKRLGNQLMVRVVDDQSRAVEGAAVSVSLFMPAHGHGAPAPAVDPLADGLYEAPSVNFTMAGTWRVTVSAEKAGLTTTQVVTVVVP